ncbi:MAG: hypothetical protein EZS28_011917 [Streblomastix strix]|uniref:Uncharacterized protein n=1 Tax=Streblomastix strix TaxID=222440 RepID=A0A5J4WC89_9EUKA|nr:MAG: hypothetical protein EZS28_011917 [Streblomastix strix]
MTRTQVLTHCRKRCANEQNFLFLNLRTAPVAQYPVDVTEHIQGGVSAGDIVFQPRIQVNLDQFDHLEETDTIIDIIANNNTIKMRNFGTRWPQQLECIRVPSLTQTRMNPEIL